MYNTRNTKMFNFRDFTLFSIIFQMFHLLWPESRIFLFRNMNNYEKKFLAYFAFTSHIQTCFFVFDKSLTSPLLFAQLITKNKKEL